MIDLSNPKGKKLISKIVVGILVFAMIVTMIVVSF